MSTPRSATLRARRTRLNVTQRHIEERFGWCQGILSHIERLPNQPGVLDISNRQWKEIEQYLDEHERAGSATNNPLESRGAGV